MSQCPFWQDILQVTSYAIRRVSSTCSQSPLHQLWICADMSKCLAAISLRKSISPGVGISRSIKALVQTDGTERDIVIRREMSQCPPSRSQIRAALGDQCRDIIKGSHSCSRKRAEHHPDQRKIYSPVCRQELHPSDWRRDTSPPT